MSSGVSEDDYLIVMSKLRGLDWQVSSPGVSGFRLSIEFQHDHGIPEERMDVNIYGMAGGESS